MVVVSQIVCLLVLVGLGVYVNRKYPLRLQLKPMILVSLFVVIALALSYFSIMIPLFGFPSLKIGVSQIPLMCIGIVFGPTYAFLAGILYDVLGLIVTPTAFPFLGFTLNNVLIGVIPALWYQQSFTSKQILRFVNIFGLLGTIIFLGYLWLYTNTATFVEKYGMMTNFMRLGITVLFVVFIVVVLWIGNRWILNKNDDELCNWLSCLIVVEVFLHLLLSPLWLEIMYAIPYMVNLFLRMVKTIIVIPLFTVVGMPIVKMVKKLARGM